jgi:hypothetical protein
MRATSIKIYGSYRGVCRRMLLSALTPPITYFCSIGMGFMLIEISRCSG